MPNDHNMWDKLIPGVHDVWKEWEERGVEEGVEGAGWKGEITWRRKGGKKSDEGRG